MKGASPPLTSVTDLKLWEWSVRDSQTVTASSSWPLSRVQMTGKGPRTVRRLSPAWFMASEHQVPDGQHDPSPPSPVNVAAGARKSSRASQGPADIGRCRGFTAEPPGATGDWRSPGGALVDTESPRAAQGAPLVVAQNERCSVGVR